MKKVGLFGGTFNPPHIGHLLFAQEVLVSFGLDEIWFIPVNVPPHKESDDLASNEDRLDMLKSATNSNDRFYVKTIELEREGRSYTIDTVKQLNEMYPTYDFSFLIGGDMIEYLPKWVSIDDLMKLVTFIGVKRPGTTVVSNEYSKDVRLIEMPQLDISSTDIRQRVHDGKPITYMVPEGVEALVKERSLYEPRTSIGNRQTSTY
ncbi:nicotinate-nucleotide adenylyltransferase [Halalkalibacter wakoensis]|nr:nicotinate-nucleotide adenylyltransferase [Halalkalibacter wakoensis]